MFSVCVLFLRMYFKQVVKCGFALCRFMTLLDSVLHYMIPAWDHSLGTFNQIKVGTHGL